MAIRPLIDEPANATRRDVAGADERDEGRDDDAALTAADHAPRWRWYHGVAFYVVVQALTYGLAALARAAAGRGLQTGNEDARALYGSVRRPFFAPPNWAFPVAWTINNAAAIWAGLRVLNLPAGTTGREPFLRLQAASWLDFVLFSAATFSVRSNLNGLVLSVAYFGLTAASVAVALRGLRDRATAVALAPLMGWVTLASALSACIVAWNRDGLYRVGPFAKPDRRWLKRS